jgi:GntR family transcriptional regulator, transcriptional repressor for pyruvate dehydrogenase complex
MPRKVTAAKRGTKRRTAARRGTPLTEAGRSKIVIGPGNGLTRPLKTSEIVARDLVRDIIRRGLQPGDGLPSEAAMLEQYKVGRESLREGLRLLEVQGLVSIRRGPGGGPIVGTVDPANLGRTSTLYYHMAGATYGELFEAWVVAESLLAERAARNPDAEARMKAMAPYLDAANGDHPPADAHEFMRVHTGFHGEVAALAQNRVLELALSTMGQIVSHHIAVTDDPRQLGDVIEHDHRRLAAAISAGYSNHARSMMEAHIRSVADLSARRVGAGIGDYIEWQ